MKPVSSARPTNTTLAPLCLKDGPYEYTVITRPGIPDWNQLPAQVLLLSRHLDLAEDSQILQLGSGHGASSLLLGRVAHRGHLHIWESNHIARLCTRATLDHHHLTNTTLLDDVTGLPPGLASACDAVVMSTPRGRDLARRCLLMAFQSLKPGGCLYLSGGNQEGIQSIVDDAIALFGPATILGYKKGHRLVRFLRGETPTGTPDWLAASGIPPGSWYNLHVTLQDRELSLASLPGVFSYDRLDDGTRLLLETVTLANPVSALDLGCGWGAIGLWAARAWQRVDMVDSNLLAVAASRRNIDILGLPNACAFPGDGASDLPPSTYTHVLTNPPFHTGREVEYLTPHTFIQQATGVLVPGGELWLVANNFIPYQKIMQPLFASTRVAARNNRFQVLVGVR